MASASVSVWRLINWRIVAGVAIPVWFLAIGLVVWQVRAKAARRASAPNPLISLPTAQVPETEIAPIPRVFETLEVVAAPHEPTPEPAIAQAKSAPKEEVDFAAATPKSEAKPLEVPPEFALAIRPEVRIEPKPACVACQAPAGETYGTKLLFAKHAVAAMRQAEADDKLVLILHIAGNLEDPGFT